MTGMQRALAVAAGLVIAGSADAAPPDTELALHIVPMPGELAPQIAATITPCPDAAQLTLGLGAWRSPVLSIQRWRDGEDSLALAILVAGQEVAMGNDTIEAPDSPVHMPGLHAPLVDALARIKLGDTAPRGSLGTLITYADGATVRVPLGPIAALDGRALGTQRDYYGTIGSDLVTGIQRALLSLKGAPTRQRALIVIGDGNDTNNEAARDALHDLRSTARSDGVELYAVIYKSPLSASDNLIRGLVPDAQVANSSGGIQPALEAIVARLGDRCVARFSTAGLPAAGRSPELVLRAGAHALATAHLPWVDGYRVPRTGARWPALVLGGLGVVALAIGVVALLRRRARATSPPAASPS
jgi:hypothetical protein